MLCVQQVLYLPLKVYIRVSCLDLGILLLQRIVCVGEAE